MCHLATSGFNAWFTLCFNDNEHFFVIGGYADPKKGSISDEDEHTDEILEYNLLLFHVQKMGDLKLVFSLIIEVSY